MRIILLPALIVAAPAFGQPAGAGGGDCNVVAGPLDVNEAGEIYQPRPSVEDCAAADVLVEDFRATRAGDYGRTVAVEGIPGPVSVYVGPMRPYGSPWPIGRPPGSSELQRHVSTWRSDRFVVVVYETSDFAGPSTTVVIADLQTQTVCTFSDWPDNEDPMNMRIPEIQEVFDEGRAGRHEAPACRIGSLAVEDVLGESAPDGAAPGEAPPR